MATATVERDMAKRTDVPVKMDAEVVRRAKIVASYRNQSLAEFLSESMRPIVDRLLEEEHDRETKAGRSPKGKGSK